MYIAKKPLTHSVYEARLLATLKKYKVATQMGNQGSSGEGTRKVCEWIWNGEIGDVKRVEAFTDRPIWPQGLPALKASRLPTRWIGICLSVLPNIVTTTHLSSVELAWMVGLRYRCAG